MKRWTLALMVATLSSAVPARADVGFVHVLPDLALAQPCGASESCLYSWTTVTRMGDALAYAEARYGKRDMSWTLLGVEFAATEAPQVWYPNFGNGKNIVIQITEPTARNEKQALFQLSHEVVHLLSPTGPDLNASVFEEGLAAFNSVQYTRDAGFEISSSYINSPSYEAAYAAIAELEGVHSDFASGVRRLRETQGGLSAISASDLRAVFPGISGALAERLAAPF